MVCFEAQGRRFTNCHCYYYSYRPVASFGGFWSHVNAAGSLVIFMGVRGCSETKLLMHVCILSVWYSYGPVESFTGPSSHVNVAGSLVRYLCVLRTETFMHACMHAYCMEYLYIDLIILQWILKSCKNTAGSLVRCMDDHVCSEKKNNYDVMRNFINTLYLILSTVTPGRSGLEYG